MLPGAMRRRKRERERKNKGDDSIAITECQAALSRECVCASVCEREEAKYFSLYLLQQELPKSIRTNCTEYISSKLTYHQAFLSDSVMEQVFGLKKVLVDPSTAFCGPPDPSVDDCMAALPTATLSTVC